jgi:hypothetical protein
MAERGLTEEDMRRIEDAAENGMSRLTGGPRRAPTRGEEYAAIGEEQLLEAVREMRRKGFREPRSRGIARYLEEDVEPSLVGQMMSSLAADGHVDRVGAESPYRWRIQES